MKKSWVVLGIIIVVAILAITRPPKPASEEVTESAKSAVSSKSADVHAEKAPAKTETKSQAARNALAVQKSVQPLKLSESAGALPKNAVHYQIDEGLVVVQGDAVVGVPADPNAPPNGLVMMPTVALWKTREIPVFVQANLSRPERVRQALELFSDTAVRFVPYTDQADVLVFEEGSGICKSYVGNVGGKQPVWIAPDCESTEIAHEIMHALGFVHEQNRSDRDSYIEVFPENIDEQFRYNFDKLPEETTKVSSLSDFDYQSIMMYPTSMFAKPGQQTMRSKTSAQILPSPGLSSKDRERLQKAYGGL